MIFVTAKFLVRPEHAARWPEIAGDFTRATRAEPGCLWFDWSRSVDDPNEYVLLEAYRDGQAAAAHVGTPHFEKAREEFQGYLQAAPKGISQVLDQDDWGVLGDPADG
ncbi:putative quinol monooxygenase [Streptosporangium sp. NPDC048865]|uniref:putative quinol monooxygenase n=1 Tax=Streptosporangium sp. NPDC048865 TaxID=3155766 RepID=UPI00344AF004